LGSRVGFQPTMIARGVGWDGGVERQTTGLTEEKSA
jgi:hypothetical protein